MSFQTPTESAASIPVHSRASLAAKARKCLTSTENLWQLLQNHAKTRDINFTTQLLTLMDKNKALVVATYKVAKPESPYPPTDSKVRLARLLFLSDAVTHTAVLASS